MSRTNPLYRGSPLFGFLVEKKFLRCLSCRRRVAAVTVHEDERDCTFREKPYFARRLLRTRDVRAFEQFGKVLLEHPLVPPRDRPRRMPRQICQLDDKTSEPRPRPARLIGPDVKLPEELVDNLIS